MKRFAQVVAALLLSLGMTVGISNAANALSWRWVGYYPDKAECQRRGAAQVNYYDGIEFDCTYVGDYGWSLSVNYLYN